MSLDGSLWWSISVHKFYLKTTPLIKTWQKLFAYNDLQLLSTTDQIKLKRSNEKSLLLSLWSLLMSKTHYQRYNNHYQCQNNHYCCHWSRLRPCAVWHRGSGDLFWSIRNTKVLIIGTTLWKMGINKCLVLIQVSTCLPDKNCRQS